MWTLIGAARNTNANCRCTQIAPECRQQQFGKCLFVLCREHSYSIRLRTIGCNFQSQTRRYSPPLGMPFATSDVKKGVMAMVDYAGGAQFWGAEFRGSSEPTVGIELELQIIDPATRDLAPG